MKFNINNEDLKEIYLISNTASYLLDKFINEESIQILSYEIKTEILINSFLKVAKSEISKIDDLIYAYALYIAIILKNDNETYNFLKKEGEINFEWFIELRSIYFSRQKPYDIIIINNDLKDFKVINQFTESSEIIETQKIYLI